MSYEISSQLQGVLINIRVLPPPDLEAQRDKVIEKAQALPDERPVFEKYLDIVLVERSTGIASDMADFFERRWKEYAPRGAETVHVVFRSDEEVRLLVPKPYRAQKWDEKVKKIEEAVRKIGRVVQQAAHDVAVEQRFPDFRRDFPLAKTISKCESVIKELFNQMCKEMVAGAEENFTVTLSENNLPTVGDILAELTAADSRSLTTSLQEAGTPLFTAGEIAFRLRASDFLLVGLREKDQAFPLISDKLVRGAARFEYLAKENSWTDLTRASVHDLDESLRVLSAYPASSNLVRHFLTWLAEQPEQMTAKALESLNSLLADRNAAVEAVFPFGDPQSESSGVSIPGMKVSQEAFNGWF